MILPFDGMENKCDVYRGDDYIKNFYASLWEQVMNIINLQNKKIILLTNEQHEFYEKKKPRYIRIYKMVQA